MKIRYLIIFYLANIVLRLLGMIELRQFPDFYAPTPAMDTDFYYFLAEMIRLKSPLITGEPYYYFPLYGWFIYGISAIFGENPYAPRIITILLGSTVPIGLYLSAKDALNSKKAAYIALFLGSFHDLFIFYDNQILKTSFEIFFITWGLYLFIKKRFLFGGLLFGLSAGIHTPVVLSVAGLSLWLLFKKEFRGAVLFFAPSLIVLALMAGRNYKVTGEFTAVAVGGIHFYTGNNANATGVYENTPGIRPNAFMYIDAKKIAEKETGKRGASPSKHFRAKALKWIKDNPEEFCWLLIRKFGLMMNRFDVPNNLDIGWIKQKTVFFRYLTLGFWLTGSLGLAGLIVLAKDRRLWPYGIFFLLYGASVIMFFVNDRYRLPIVIPLIIYAAGFFEYALRADTMHKRTFYAITLLVAFLFVNLNSGIPAERYLIGTNAKMSASREALRLKTEMKKTTDKNRLSHLYTRLGDLYLKVGGWEQGRYYYWKAFQTNPENERAEMAYYQMGLMGIRPVIIEN